MNRSNNLISRINKRQVALAAISIVSFILAISIATNAIIPVSFIPGISTISKDSSNYYFNSAAVQNQNSIVPLDQIVSGGPPPDGIPSIDNPKFMSLQEAEEFLEDSDLVVGLNINGDMRAYPLQILVWHEIVNDIVGKTQ